MTCWKRVQALEVLEDMLGAGVEIVEARRPDLYVEPAHRLTARLEVRIRAVKPHLLDVLDPPEPDGPCEACGAINFVRRSLGHWRCPDCRPIVPAEVAEYFLGPCCWSRNGRSA